MCRDRYCFTPKIVVFRNIDFGIQLESRRFIFVLVIYFHASRGRNNNGCFKVVRLTKIEKLNQNLNN